MKAHTVAGTVLYWLAGERQHRVDRQLLTVNSRSYRPLSRKARVPGSLLLAAALLLQETISGATFSLDDGTVDTCGGTAGGDLLALNQFDTGGRAVIIDRISVLWNPLSAAVSPAVALYADPNGDGNPSDATPLLIHHICVQPNVVILNNTTLQDYDIPPTAVEGSFFVGAYLSDATADFNPVIGVDKTTPRPNQSWIIENSNGPGLLDLDHPIATSTLVTPLNTYVNGNHMIRARYTVVPSCVTPPAGLVSWWRAEGDALDTVDGNDGKSVIGIGFVPGKVGQSFVFDGTNSSITIPASSSLSVTSFTIEAWINPGEVGSQRPIVEYGSGKTWSGVHFWISVPMGGGPGSLFANIRSLSSGLDENIVSSAPGLIQPNQWSHVALTFDQASGEARLFLDGTNVASRNLGSIVPQTALPLNIGLRPVGVEDGGGLRFLGRIDELSLYSRALADSEIRAIYDAGSAGKCVPPPTFPPTITGQPEDQAKKVGDTAAFSVQAMGTEPLGYQWFFNQTDLPGATNAVLILNDVQTYQAGPYFVTVTNPYGSVTSSNAHLLIEPLRPPVCVPLPSGAVAWWRAESNTVDSIGINDGLLQGVREPLLNYMPGKVDTAFRFLAYQTFPTARVTNYLLIPSSADLDVGAGDGLTVEGWIKPDSVSGVKPLVEWNDGCGNVGVGIGLSGSALEAAFTDANAVPDPRVIVCSPPGLVVTSAWQHVALTFNRSDGQATIYFNGFPVARQNLGEFTPQTRSAVYLAFHPDGVSGFRSYSGGMDEVTIYDRALAAAEIQGIIAAAGAGKCPPPPPQCVPAPSGLVAWWRGESNLLDSVDSNHGIPTATISYPAGVVGQAFQLVVSPVIISTAGYVRVPASSNLNVGSGPGFTIEGWIAPSTYGGWWAPPIITMQFAGWHGGTATQGVSFSLTWPIPIIQPPTPYSVTVVWEANLTDIQGQPHVLRSPSDLPIPVDWQHVAVTYDKATGMAVLYFNGSAVTRTNLGIFTPDTTGDLHLGYQSRRMPTRTGSGAMDEVSLYSRALSAAEIRAIMLSRSAGKCMDPPAILSQPASLRINEGGNAAFALGATGNPLLKYQWLRNGVPLDGANDAVLTLDQVQDGQAGVYSVRVTNWFGSVISSNAVLQVNHPPIADVSATRTLVISPIHCPLKVVLDGSRSSDPDGDTLKYSWFRAGERKAFATGVVAVVTLPQGPNFLRLMVDDGLAADAQTFTVRVVSPARAIERLIALVGAEAPKPRPLIASLSAALRSVLRGNETAAINQLGAFQNKVHAQVEPSAPDLAARLTRFAQAIIDALRCGSSPGEHRGRIRDFTRHDDGKVKIRFTAPPGPAYIIEASSNLVDWERIGVAADAGAGEFEFEDANHANGPARFYRIVVP